MAEKYINKFVDPNEVAVATLSNGIMQGVIKRENLSDEKIILTNKRLYIHSVLNYKAGTHQIIDASEITSTKITTKRSVKAIVAALIFAVIGLWLLYVATLENPAALFPCEDLHNAGIVALVMAAILAVLFFAFKKSVLCICYRGGNAEINLKDYAMAIILEFQEAIHIVKDGHLPIKN